MTFVEPSTAASDDSISRSAAINVVKKYLRINKDLFDAIEYELGNLPSAQSEIVRCKDCKWKQGSECVRFAEVRPFPDDFCSRAERRKK